jgi:hypothetical protein
MTFTLSKEHIRTRDKVLELRENARVTEALSNNTTRMITSRIWFQVKDLNDVLYLL